MSTIPRIDELAAPPMVGMRYLVPTVRYPWLGKVDNWPVMGPRHEDAEHLRFGSWHYHVDYRFLTERQCRAVKRRGGWPAAVLTAGQPLSYRGDDGVCLPHPEPVWKPLACYRVEHHYPNDIALKRAPNNSLFAGLHRAYHGRKCPRNAAGLLVCPHKGFVLGSLQPDVLGHVVCPLHGLRIDTVAGIVVSEVKCDG